MKYDDVPWHDSSKWKPGKWYPLPNGSCWLPKLTVVEGYGIYIQDPEATDDILPIDHDGLLTFRNACKICEAHNGEPLEGLI